MQKMGIGLLDCIQTDFCQIENIFKSSTQMTFQEGGGGYVAQQVDSFQEEMGILTKYFIVAYFFSYQ